MHRFISSKGQSVIEFALLLVFVAFVILVSLSVLGVSLGDTFSSVSGSI